jgi:heat-inducible transcriptional repressor
MLSLVSQSEGDRVNVLIGSENNVKVMNNSSLVYKTVKKNGRTVGVIGVLGPRRMDYARVLATLDNLGANITNLLNEPKLLDKGE